MVARSRARTRAFWRRSARSARSPDSRTRGRALFQAALELIYAAAALRGHGRRTRSCVALDAPRQLADLLIRKPRCLLTDMSVVGPRFGRFLCGPCCSAGAGRPSSSPDGCGSFAHSVRHTCVRHPLQNDWLHRVRLCACARTRARARALQQTIASLPRTPTVSVSPHQ